MDDNNKEKTLLERISSNIHRSMEQNTGNIDRFNNSREFVLKSTLSAKTKNSLSATNAPILEFNISEAFLSRLRGEFAQNEPGISVTISETSNNTPELEQTREIIEGHVRYILDEANRSGVQTSIFDEVISGGFSVAKVFTAYEEGKTFKQKIIFSKCYDSTLTGFDVLSREPSRKDSDYAFELFSYPKERFEEEFDMELKDVEFSKDNGKFNWYYKIGDQEVVVVADYYEKKIEKVKIVELSTGEVIEKKEYSKLIEQLQLMSLEAPPVITDERELDVEKIMRYQLIGDTILKKEELKNADMLPLIFFDGNSVVLNDGGSKTEVMCRPYLINCLGAQKLYNNLGIALADECQSLSKHKILLAEESISPNYVDHITKPQQYDTLVYRAFYNNDPTKPNPPPIQMARNAFPPEMLQLFTQVPNIFQNILGSYDAEMGINGNNISGTAILQGSIHSSATAKPYINKYILSLNQVAKAILHLIPKVYVGEMSVPIITRERKTEYRQVNSEGNPNLKYESTTFNINVEAGIGSTAAKTQALTQIVQLAQAMPVFAQFMNTKGLKILVGNLDIHGQDLLKLLAEEFQAEVEQEKKMMQQQQMQQAQMPNPMVMREQNKAMEIQGQMHKSDVQASLDAGELELKRQELKVKEEDILAKMAVEKDYMQLEKDKLEVAKAELVTNLAHDKINMYHKHKMDQANHHLTHKKILLDHHHKTTGKPHFSGK
jgi:hypothetical protein